MKKQKFRNVAEIVLPITDFSLEEFEEIIHSGRVEGEVPFDLLAEHYPELMLEWYPGYPGTPRPMTEEDPIPAQAQVQNRSKLYSSSHLHTPSRHWFCLTRPLPGYASWSDFKKI